MAQHAIWLIAGLLVGALIGTALGWRLARRQHPPARTGNRDAGDARFERDRPGTAGPSNAGGGAPSQAASSPRTGLPVDVQALLDKGEAFQAVKQLRLLQGGLAARRLAREHLQAGTFALPPDIRRLADGGNKIGAIQTLCEQTHMDLTLARELVERHAASPR